MSKKILLLIGALMAAILAWSALDKFPHQTQKPTALELIRIASKENVGEYLTNKDGLALYIFDNDPPLQSSCQGACLENWPPYLIPTEYNALPKGRSDVWKKINVFSRENGARQYALGTQPLYYYAGDSKPGDTFGNGINDVWHLARP